MALPQPYLRSISHAVERDLDLVAEDADAVGLGGNDDGEGVASTPDGGR
jgi:hypothetical protein